MKKIILSLIVILALAPAAGAYPEKAKLYGEENYNSTGEYRNSTLQYWYKMADSFTAGDGSAENPYVISRFEQLRLLNDYGCGEEGKGRYFTLDTDLHEGMLQVNGLGSYWVYFVPIGSEEKPFEGILDAAGHNIDANSDKIFNVIGENGVVRNVIKYSRIGIAGVNHGLIENCRVLAEGTGEKVTKNVGGIAGENTGIIRKCTVHGTKENSISRGFGNYNIDASGTGIGGIAGYNDGGIIEECHACLLMTGRESSRAVGGIAGDNSRGIIRNCFTNYYVEGKGSETGGIVGRLNSGTIENCATTGNVGGSYNLSGMLVGGAYNNSKIINCYAESAAQAYYSLDRATYGGEPSQVVPTIGNATHDTAEYGISDEDMRKIETYQGFDFENVWTMREGGYPALRIMYEFPDTYTHWARDYIEFLAERGVISGYEDGTFRPDDNITKAEILMMAARAVKESKGEFEMPFTDVPDWLSPYVSNMYFYNNTKEILKNIRVSETELGAKNNATRLETAYIAGKYNRASDEMPKYAKLNFTDADKIPEWAQTGVYFSGVRGYEDGSFRPDNSVTRAEAAVIIKELYEYQVWKKIYSY